MSSTHRIREYSLLIQTSFEGYKDNTVGDLVVLIVLSASQRLGEYPDNCFSSFQYLISSLTIRYLFLPYFVECVHRHSTGSVVG